MKNLLRYPSVNAICISLFTAFYAWVFIFAVRAAEMRNILYYITLESRIENQWLWVQLSQILANGHHVYFVYVMMILTVIIDIMLISRRKLYDEYHVDQLRCCLSCAICLALIIIAVFYFMILKDPVGIVEKFSFFVMIHWLTVVAADLVFVLLCSWR